MTQKYDQIIDYYDSCEADYKLFWGLEKNLAMHAGFWDKTTKSLNDALERENEILAEKARITEKDHVLDAGCGVGGSGIYLAKKYGCRVTGITLSQKQAEKARNLAKKHAVQDKLEFHVMDYTKTDFPDKSFDVVWGLESICHAQNKAVFIKEACRLLNNSGRIIIADGFLRSDKQSSKQTNMMQKWLSPWAVKNLDTVENFRLSLNQNGFTDISFVDVTQNILPSSKRLFLYSIPGIFFSKLGEFIGKRSEMQTQNIKGAYYQYITLKRRFWKYGIFFAEKKSL